MHGKNKIRGTEKHLDGSLQVQSIWKTIQGEGPFSGMPAIFIRLSGCNLACHFCDTEWNDEKDPIKTVEQIMQEVRDLSIGAFKDFNRQLNLVVLTGGEPLRQDLYELIQALALDNFQVQIETDGVYWQECLNDEHVTIVCSPKIKHVHSMIKKFCQHWKYIIRWREVSKVDGLPQEMTQKEPPNPKSKNYLPLFGKFGVPARPPESRLDDVTIWVSPCDEGVGNEAETALNTQMVGELVMKHGYRAQVQLHKILQLP